MTSKLEGEDLIKVANTYGINSDEFLRARILANIGHRPGTISGVMCAIDEAIYATAPATADPALVRRLVMSRWAAEDLATLPWWKRIAWWWRMWKNTR